MTIKSILTTLPMVLLGWIATLVIVALLTDEAPAYVVVLPQDGLLRNLPDDTAVLTASRFSVTVASDMSGFAKSLYASGARLVLPARLPGCLPLPKV